MNHRVAKHKIIPKYIPISVNIGHASNFNKLLHVLVISHQNIRPDYTTSISMVDW